MNVANSILRSLDKNHISILTLLDLSAAFDTIDHDILFRRIETSFGISGLVLAWLKSYLTDRSQMVSVHGVHSQRSQLTFGVPQGSVLGPILFIMYRTPLSDLIEKHALRHESFADDTQLFNSGSLKDVPKLIETQQKCINDIGDWMLENKLKLNEEKTEVLFVIPPSLKNDPSIPSSMLVAGNVIPLSLQVRNIGVIFDDTMSFEHQISAVVKASYFEIRKISSIRHYLTTEATKTLVCSLVLTRLDYANSLLAGSTDKLLGKLQKVQNHAARLVTKTRMRHHITPVLHSLHWLDIKKRIQYKVATMCHSYFIGTAPHYMSDMLTRYRNLPQLRSASDTNQLMNPKRKLNKSTVGERSFSFQGPSVWGSLPRELRDIECQKAFKSSLKTHLFRH